jgi:hypothetical protein
MNRDIFLAISSAAEEARGMDAAATARLLVTAMVRIVLRHANLYRAVMRYPSLGAREEASGRAELDTMVTKLTSVIDRPGLLAEGQTAWLVALTAFELVRGVFRAQLLGRNKPDCRELERDLMNILRGYWIGVTDMPLGHTPSSVRGIAGH